MSDTPATAAGRALLLDLHEPKGPCWQYGPGMCDHATGVLAIEAEYARLAGAAEEEEA